MVILTAPGEEGQVDYGSGPRVHEADELTVRGNEIIAVLRALHTPGFHGRLSADACKILNWTSAESGYSQGWVELVKAFNGPAMKPAFDKD